MKPIKAAIIQNAPDHTTPEANRDTLLQRLEEASRNGAALIVCPECAVTGYATSTLSETWALAESLSGPTAERVRQHCSKTGAHVAYGLLERHGDDIYNTALLMGPGGIIGVHRKAHIAPVGADKFVRPGDEIAVFDMLGTKVGLSICYEVRFPEVARSQALAGAKLLIVLANWPAGAEVNPGIMAPARAAENNLPLLAGNRCGRDGEMRFLGRSAAYAPDGRIIESATTCETILYATVTPGAGLGLLSVNDSKYSVDLLSHRRPDLYAPITDTSPGLIDTDGRN